MYNVFDNFLTTFFMENRENIDNIDNLFVNIKVVKSIETIVKTLICAHSSTG